MNCRPADIFSCHNYVECCIDWSFQSFRVNLPQKQFKKQKENFWKILRIKSEIFSLFFDIFLNGNILAGYFK